MQNRVIGFLLVLSVVLSGTRIFAVQKLTISDNHRYLQVEDGTPFFYLGDTAWMLFHRLNRQEAEKYLQNRAEKGFTVIQAVVLAEHDGISGPNAYGELALKDKDPTQPNEDYFNHVDDIVDMADRFGLYIGMLPCWGKYWSENNPEQTIFTPENALIYGRFLGERYKDKPVIWILGGDHNIHTETERQTIIAMAQGLREGDGGNHLMTFHPRGPGFSSDYFHEADWLDFNMVQSSHGAHDHDNGLFIEHDYALKPFKPTLDGEPRYENIPVGFYFSGNDWKDKFTDYDCRQAAYWAILAGACGHTFGNNSVWQMVDTNVRGVLDGRIPWHIAIDHPGADQMTLLKHLFTVRPFHRLMPCQSMILSGPNSGGGKIRAALAADSSYAIIYSPRGAAFTIDKSFIKAKKRKEIWFDPRYGFSDTIHSGDTAGMQTYTPPTMGKGNDWILIIEDADLDLPMP
ncbi:DUF4038 domain-containing protein [candidate division KSB1 bacterium]|nr:DUF4038 domain-containing protein [candidate division KSB1 bacterium]